MKRRLLHGALISVVGVLAACAAPSGTSGKPAAASVLRVTGSVAYLQRIALGPDALVIVQLLDVSRVDAAATVLAEQRFTAPHQVPLPFELRVDAGKIDPRLRYSVSARILQGGKLAFINDTAYPVLTQGNPDRVAMVLRMVAQP